MKQSKLLMTVIVVMVLLGAGLTGSLIWGKLRSEWPVDGCRVDFSVELNRSESKGSYRISLQVEFEPTAYHDWEPGLEAWLERSSGWDRDSWTGIPRGGKSQ